METNTTEQSIQSEKSTKKLNFVLTIISAILLIIIIVMLGVIIATGNESKDDSKNLDTNNQPEANENADTIQGVPEKETPTEKLPATVQSENIRLNNLAADQTISSPTIIEGEAKFFFSEGEFLVEVYNNTDALIGFGRAVAQKENWMNGEFTPFLAEVKFNNGSETSGKVIFKSANPSGLPENDESYTLNVNFTEQKVQVNDISNLLRNKLPNRITVTGSAKAFYFEGQFQVELQDANSNLIVRNFAIAQGEWTQNEYVPFSVDITYVTPENMPTGKLVFKKDNPSGLPENDLSYEIPVLF